MLNSSFEIAVSVNANFWTSIDTLINSNFVYKSSKRTGPHGTDKMSKSGLAKTQYSKMVTEDW